jgi:hypothetical protein
VAEAATAAVPARAVMAPRRSVLPLVLGLPVLALVSLVAMVVSPMSAIGVPLLAGLAYALYRLPLKVSAIAVMSFAFFCEGLEGPLANIWEAPGHTFAQYMLVNMNAYTGLGFLRAPLIDILTVGLWAVASLRDKNDGWTSRLPSVRPMNLALIGSVAMLVLLDALGTARGGNFNESLWQLRHTILFPVRVVVLLRALDGTLPELKTIAKVLIAVGVVKALIGIYFLKVIIEPTGRDVEYTTSHTDTLLFVPLLAMFMNLMIERFTWARMMRALPWVVIVLWGMACNDRRLAYVCLAFSGTASLLIAPWTRFKKILWRVALYGGPFFALYTWAGWNQPYGRFFFFARLAKSIIVGDQDQGDQADYRDLENVNVLSSWAESPVIPNGYGHKFNLLFPLPDISNYFPTWQYHPHNQYLWTMAIGGPIGFTVIMLPLVLTLYLAARTYRFAEHLHIRVAMLTCIAMVISVFAQWYGDMGGLSWTVSWMGALAAALACKWAIRTGAWPSPLTPEQRIV